MFRNIRFMQALLLGALLCCPAFAGDKKEAATASMTAEEIGSWVQETNFPVWITRMPSLSVLLARYPFAANLFYLRADFKAWSERFPVEARTIAEAALRWQNLNESEKETFFSRHPVLRSKDMAGPVRGDGLNPQQRAQ